MDLVARWVGVYAHPGDLILGNGWQDRSALQNATLPFRSVDAARRRFDRSGGRSNLSSSPAHGSDSPSHSSERGSSSRVASRFAPGAAAETELSLKTRLRRVALGLGALFVPMSLLIACCDLTMPIGPAVLDFADLDTVYSLAMLMAAVWVYRRQRQRCLPAAHSWQCSPGTVLLLAGYAVSNYGTLVRLRMRGMVPLWLLPVIALRFVHEDATQVPTDAARVKNLERE